MNLLLQRCSNLVNPNEIDTHRSLQWVAITMVGIVLRLRVLHFGSVIFDPGMLAQLTGCGDMINMNVVESPNEVESLTLLACTKL
jgi:hypothetical protein